MTLRCDDAPRRDDETARLASRHSRTRIHALTGHQRRPSPTREAPQDPVEVREA
ncbi:hypothetical protein HETIRDRAFT_434966 [Heterobasidion irregulare TC 32-1]|uniref:Uncharacterized protein n=1 Tax=Heterobasidion irregulare (strain TC 32-1) TaxID=747525 RepID=W4K5X9_HETIT|nr:uncharacterized protein HETIRDRAFT_434966 [Heterobasidion irregulare TC 32-1]ETW81218.1 hypothetical protein HETIRDRAFT_434966 [Heterobasidion irregulare TC 32-1]